MKSKSRLYYVSVLLSCSVLTACGGGSTTSTSISRQVTPPPPPPPVPQLSASDFRTAEYNNNPALEAVGAAEAYAQGYTGDGVIIGVFDFNFDLSAGDVNYSSDSRGRNQTYVDIYEAQIGDTASTNPHARSVAVVAAGVKDGTGTHGLAFDAEVLAVDFFSGVDLYQVTQDGILYSVSDPWTYMFTRGARIANKSLGYDEDDIISNPPSVSERYVTEFDTNFVFAGGLLVSSAGNNGDPEPSLSNLDALDRLREGGALDSGDGAMIIVGAVDENNVLASFSDAAGDGESQSHFMVAPGVDVVSYWETDDDGPGLYFLDGTSFSAPLVSGAAALIMQRWPSLTAREVRQVLFDSATDLGAPGVDNIYGHGMLNVNAAVRPIGTVTVPTPGAAAGGTPSGVQVISSGGFGDGQVFQRVLSKTMVLDKFGRDFSLDLSGSHQSSFQPIQIAQTIESRRNWQSTGFSLPGGFQFSGGVQRDQAIINHSWAFSDFERQQAISEGATAEFNIALEDRSIRFGIGRSLSAAMTPDSASNLGAGLPADGISLTRERAGEPGGYSNIYFTNSQLVNGGRVTWGFSMSKSAPRGQAGPSLFIADPAIQFESRHKHVELRYDTVGPASNWFASAGITSEKGSILGARIAGAVGLADDAVSLVMRSGWSSKITEKLGLKSEAAVWLTDPGVQSAGLLGDTNQLVSTSANVSMTWSGAFQQNDAISLMVKQPLRIESGHTNASVALGLDRFSGDVIWDSQKLSLSPSGREVAVELAWKGNFGAWQAETRLALRENAGHRKGARDSAAMLYLARNF